MDPIVWKLVAWFVLAAAVAVAYVWIVRPLLKARPAFSHFYAEADGFWRAVGSYVDGFKTKLWARFLTALGLIAGGLVPLLDWLQGAPIAPFVPERWQPFLPLALSVIGPVTAWLRNHTTGPAGA